MTALALPVAAAAPQPLPRACWVVGWDAVAALRAEWQALWQADPQADLFGSWDWFMHLGAHYGRDHSATAIVHRAVDGMQALAGGQWTPQLALLRDANGRLRALLPLVALPAQWRGRAVALLATPTNTQAPRGALLARDFDHASAAALAALLAARREVDLLLLDGLRADDGRATRLLDALARRGLPAARTTQWPSVLLRHDGSLDDYFGGADRAHFRRSLVKAGNGLSKLGAVSVDCHAGDDWRAGFDAFVQVDADSWKAADGECVGSDPALLAYYQALCERLAARGWLEIWVLRVDGRAAAAFICPHDGRQRYTLKCSVSLACGSQRSPGLVLMDALVRQTWRRGATGIDFVGKVPFLDRWANHDMALLSALLPRARTLRWRLHAERQAAAAGQWLAAARAGVARRLRGAAARLGRRVPQ